MEIEFSFEDDSMAGLWRLQCTCGLVLRDQGDEIVADGDIIRCPTCHRAYKFIWKGMTVEG